MREDVARLVEKIKGPGKDSSMRALGAIDDIAEKRPKEVYDELRDVLVSFYDDLDLTEIVPAFGWYGEEGNMCHPEPVVKALTSVLMDRECFNETISTDLEYKIGEVRKLVLEALELISSEHPVLVNRYLLKVIVKHTDEWGYEDYEEGDMLCMVVELIGDVCQGDEKAVTVLRRVLKQYDDFPQIREKAVGALQDIAEVWEEESAVRAVVIALEDEDSWVRERALEALESVSRYSPELVVEQLIRALGKGDKKTDRRVVGMLAGIGSEKPELVMKPLVKALKSANKEKRGLALRVLKEIG